LGQPTTLRGAQAAVSFLVLRPSLPGLGAPDAVYVDRAYFDGQVSLVYRPRTELPRSRVGDVGLLVTEFRATVARRFVVKDIGPGATVEGVVVNGREGLWIAGRPHGLFYTTLDGRIAEDTFRLADHALVWEQGGVTVRLEGSLSLSRALAIAGSMR
jgi:hypothetical protein